MSDSFGLFVGKRLACMHLYNVNARHPIQSLEKPNYPDPKTNPIQPEKTVCPYPKTIQYLFAERPLTQQSIKKRYIINPPHHRVGFNFANVPCCFYLRSIVQKLVAAILLLAFFGQTFNQGFYYVDYLLGKAEYVKSCINKSRPKMHCNGKCLLMRKIGEQEKREQQKAPEMKLAGKVEVLPSKNWYAAFIPFYFDSIAQIYSAFNEGSPIDQPCSVFHPPSA